MFKGFDFDGNFDNEDMLQKNVTTTPKTTQNQSQFETTLILGSINNSTSVSKE